MTIFKKLWKEERGQGMTEYGLILALIVIAVIGVLSTMGTELFNKFTDVNTTLQNAPSVSP